MYGFYQGVKDYFHCLDKLTTPEADAFRSVLEAMSMSRSAFSAGGAVLTKVLCKVQGIRMSPG